MSVESQLIHTRKRIDQLDRRMRPKAWAILGYGRVLGVRLTLVQGRRTVAHQNKLFAQGRTTRGRKVTNARGGQSYHNYGLATDWAGVNDDGSINWNMPYAEIASFAERELDLYWGGHFPAQTRDAPHLEYRFLPWQRLMEIAPTGRLPA